MTPHEALRDEIVNTLAISIGRPGALDLLFRYEATAATTRMRALAEALDRDDEESNS